MLSHLDVILIVDDTLRLPKPKLVVCVDPEFGVFFRINTKRWPVPVLLRKADHPFLDHDSFLECNEGLELDDQIVADSLRRHNGPVGALAVGIVPDIVARWRANGRYEKVTRRKSLAA